MSERVIAYLHQGRKVRGSVWSVADGKPRMDWVVQIGTGELHKVTPRRGAVGAHSDGNTYTASGNHDHARCACVDCKRTRQP